MKKLYSLASIVAISVAVFSCAEDSDTSVNTEKFTSIFDVADFNAEYEPLDILQAPDGGYIVLSARPSTESDYSAIHILKADAYGNFASELVVNDSLLNPLSSLTYFQDKFYFVCMNSNTGARIVSFDADLGNIATKAVSGLTYPSAASFIPGDQAFALLGYNSEDKQTLITEANLNGTLTAPLKSFSTGNGGGEIIIDQIMIEHFLHNGKHFPFIVGRTNPNLPNGTFYFNGFVDYNFSLCFTTMAEDDAGQFVFGENDDGGFSALSNISGNNFAVARFHYGDNYLSPNEGLTSSIIENATLKKFPELEPNARVKILRTTINEKNVVIYGGNTKSKQMGLFYFNEADKSFINSRYLGFSNPYEFSSISPTSDGGLVVCGRTFLAGRFPRICIFKLSEEDATKDVPATN